MDIASPNTEELTTARWFVMRAYKSEKRAEEKLKGKDGLEYFIPKYYAVRVYHGVKSKRLVPVIPNLVFVHASRIQITEFKKRYNFLQFVMWEKSTGLEYLVVPDDQMESFIRVSSQYDTVSTPYLLPVIKDMNADARRQYKNAAHLVNDKLKKLGVRLGLDIPLTSYVARHGWASIARSRNIPLATISEAMGHDSEKTTRIYLASLDTSSVDKANSQILKAL